MRLPALVAAILCVAASAAAGPGEHVTAATVELPQTLEWSISNWGTWGLTTLGPRLYHAPRADGSELLGWTDGAGNGHVSVISPSGALGTTHTFDGARVKGLVAHADGGYAVLLWREAADTIALSRRTAAGAEVWAAPLQTTITVFDDAVGDARLAYGNGLYAAYYTVYGTGSWLDGHHGDQLRFVSDAGIVSGGWEWGCSHSMAELIAWDPALGFEALCVSDCYPSTGLVSGNAVNLLPADGNCGGLVSLQLGQLAAGTGEWKAVVNAEQSACCGGEGIGFVRFGGPGGTLVHWLTASDGATERDPVLARLPDDGGSERYLVGWRTTDDGQYHLAVTDGAGAVLEGPEPVADRGIYWGRRDDSFRSRPDGSVSWFDGLPGASSVTFYRYQPGRLFADGFETGGTLGWSACTGD